MMAAALHTGATTGTLAPAPADYLYPNRGNAGRHDGCHITIFNRHYDGPSASSAGSGRRVWTPPPAPAPLVLPE